MARHAPDMAFGRPAFTACAYPGVSPFGANGNGRPLGLPNLTNGPRAARYGIGLLIGVRYQARYYRKRSCRLAGWSALSGRNDPKGPIGLRSGQARPAVFYPCRGTPPSSDPPRPALRGGRVTDGDGGSMGAVSGAGISFCVWGNALSRAPARGPSAGCHPAKAGAHPECVGSCHRHRGARPAGVGPRPAPG
jgi:hypothetical protein